MSGPEDAQVTEAAAQRDQLWDIARLVLDVVVLLVALWALWESRDFRPLAAYFPRAAAWIIAVAVVVQLAVDLVNFVRRRPVILAGMDVESPIHGLGLAGLVRALRYIGWFVGFIALVYVTGVFVAAAVFIAAFFRVEARWSWFTVALFTVSALVVVWAMFGGLGLQTPRTMLDIGHDLL